MQNLRAAVQFGKPAAEFEAAELEHYFVENRAFERLHSGPRRVLIGNRGAGKSAIFSMLARRDGVTGNVAISLAPQDYSYQMLQDVTAARVDGNWGKTAAYAAAWKYVMLTLALRKIAAIDTTKQRPGKDEKALNRFSNDHRRRASQKPLEALVSYLERFEDVTQHSSSTAQRTSELARLYDLEEISEYLPLLSKIPGGKEVHIYVDELDLGWDGSDEARAFIAGLFQACVTINRNFPKVKVYMAVRQELFNSVPGLRADAEKYRDLFERITWDAETLFSVITKRISHYFPHGGSYQTKEDVWKMAFSDLASYRFMLERSLYRPRELIVYCTDALDFARRYDRPIPMSQRTVDSVEDAVSKDRLADVVAENQFQYESLDALFRIFANGPSRFERERLLLKLLGFSMGDEVPTERLPDWARMADPNDLLEMLWRTGFLLIDAGVGARASFGARAGSPDDETVSIDTAKSFTIHPMFRRALRIIAI